LRFHLGFAEYDKPTPHSRRGAGKVATKIFAKMMRCVVFAVQWRPSLERRKRKPPPPRANLVLYSGNKTGELGKFGEDFDGLTMFWRRGFIMITDFAIKAVCCNELQAFLRVVSVARKAVQLKYICLAPCGRG